MAMLTDVLKAYSIKAHGGDAQVVGQGLINDTWMVEDTSGNAFILQRVNHSVFKKPHIIDQNLRLLQVFLNKECPEYVFTSPIPSSRGETLTEVEGNFYRIFHFVPDSHCFDTVQRSELAYEAAKQFGEFTSTLSHFDANQLTPTIIDFHNLALRCDAYLASKQTADSQRLHLARNCMDIIETNKNVLETYQAMLLDPEMRLRVCHHDTKISNVLFDSTGKGICIIDLDTVMPGYFISDIGDMFRTYLCAESEEALIEDPLAPRIRMEYFTAIVKGYLYHMRQHLTATECKHIVYAGKFMLFMQGVRFLTDFLNNDVYYKTTHQLHNLNRAVNQLTLLEEYCRLESQMESI
eukprot:gene21391-24267_t